MQRLILSSMSAIAVWGQGQRVVPKHWGGPRFSGQRILVTGGDSGIGLAAVEAFFYECGSVLLTGHSEAKSRKAFDKIQALPPPTGCPTTPKLAWFAGDISDAEVAKALVSTAVRELGGLDVAVNNAGAAGDSTEIGDKGFPEHFARSVEMSVNVRGTLNCMNAQIRHWLETKSRGVMVNVASIYGELSWPGDALYMTSKWAEIGFSKEAAQRYARSGIRINILAPGAVDTEMLRQGMSEDDPAWIAIKAGYEKIVPQGRVADPWEMAGPITFLASDMSSYLTGHVLTADGGVVDAPPTVAQAHAEAGAGDAIV